MLKLSRIICVLLASLVPLAAQEATADWQVEIPPPVIVGGSADTSPPPVAPAFTVLETRTLRRDVAEAPPMPGLPPVEGRISVTVRKVADPGLPELPEPLPPTSPDDAAVQEQTEEFRENHKGTDLVSISATVYGNSRTFLRIQPNGSTGGEVTAWSNIDFNHFSGFVSYRVTSPDGETRDCSLLMGIGNEDEPPQIPGLRDIAEGPAFVIVDGKDSGSGALDTLAQVHRLYAKEGGRMAEAHIRRVAEEDRLRGHYLANPPKPRDVVISYWRGKRADAANPGGEVEP